MEVDSHSSTSIFGLVSSLEVVAVDSHITVIVSCIQPCFRDAQHVGITFRVSHYKSQSLRAFDLTNPKPLGRSSPNVQLSFTVSSYANGMCVAANADVSAAASIIVTADGIDTFSNEISCGTNGDAVTVDTVDLALIKMNLDLSTISAKFHDTVGSCVRLLLLQRVWGLFLGDPVTESIGLCFCAPPRQPGSNADID